MIANATPLTRAAVTSRAAAWAEASLLLVGLGLVIGARWAGTRAGLDPLAIGAVFGIVLIAIGWTRPSPPAARNVVIGLAAGIGLVALTGLGAAIAASTLPSGLGRPAAPFLPWAAVTIVVAAGEESILRGRLFDVTRRTGGTLAAVALTSIAFALLHVPLYGWHVVPLDLGVGVAFAGLRLLTGGIAAPATAHAVADLATWWL